MISSNVEVLKEKLYEKIAEKGKSVDTIVSIVVKNVSSDIVNYILKGLTNIKNIVLALPFTTYGWYLAIYEIVGKAEDDKIIVYYNSENPYWTASIIVHELTHKALNIKHKTITDLVIDETLAYLASFKSNKFLELYEKGIVEIIKLLSKYMVPREISEHDLANIYIPRILAKNLISYNFSKVVKEAKSNFNNLVILWLKSNPNKILKTALSVALSAIGLSPETYGLEKQKHNVRTITTSGIIGKEIAFEGVDSNYLEMKKMLEKAAKEPNNVRKTLSPWWKEIEPIADHLEAYIIWRRQNYGETL